MKTIFKTGLIAILGVSMTLTSCKKKGCIEETAKNYNSEAQKDDGSCEYYSNTELLTMSTWKYVSSDASVDSLESEYDTFLTGMTMYFRADGTYDIDIPSDTEAGVNDGTWEFQNNESELLLDKGKSDEQVIKVIELTIDFCEMEFNDSGNQGVTVSIKMNH